MVKAVVRAQSAEAATAASRRAGTRGRGRRMAAGRAGVAC